MPKLKDMLIILFLILGFLGFLFSFGEDINLREGINILLTPNPIIREGIIALAEDISIRHLTSSGNISVVGDILIEGDILSLVDQELNASFFPTLDNRFDIGSAAKRWKDLWISNDGYFAGSVGIGTASPGADLHVHNPTTSSSLFLTTDRDNADVNLYLGNDVDGTPNYAGIVFDASEDNLNIFNANSLANHLVIDNAGNIGIGTASPDAKLHIEDAGLPLNLIYTGASSETSMMQFKRSADTAGNKLRIFSHREDVGSRAYTAIKSVIDSPVNAWGELRFTTRGAGGFNEQMTIDQDGKVGIGTTDPGFPFHISSALDNVAKIESTDTVSTLQIQDSVDTVFVGSYNGNAWFGPDSLPSALGITLDLSAGNVGIGTITPTTKLNVVGDFNQTEGNITGNFIRGQMWFNDATSVTNTITTQNVYINVTGFNSGDDMAQYLNGVGYNNASEYLECVIDGNYEIKNDQSYGNAGNNQEYEFVIGKNSVPQPCTTSHRKVGSAGDVGDSGDSGCYIDCVNGDRITLMARNKDGTADLLMHFGKVTMERKGD